MRLTPWKILFYTNLNNLTTCGWNPWREISCLKYWWSFYLVIWRNKALRPHCCGHIVVDTNVSPFAGARNICCGHKFCVQDTKNVSATNVSQFAQPKKHHGQHSVCNNVSSFTRALSLHASLKVRKILMWKNPSLPACLRGVAVAAWLVQLALDCMI